MLENKADPIPVRDSSLTIRAVGQPRYDAIVVGAGFAGLYMVYKLVELGLKVKAFEQGSDVGGVWYWNRYPGARCDIESMQYSYSFSDELQQEWDWSERYATQPEILRYISHVSDRFQLRQYFQFDTSVESVLYDENESTWTVKTGEGKTTTARYLILATGCLSSARRPDIPGLSNFKGKLYLTSHWPHTKTDFTGQRVGVIGTGSSGIQTIPVVAQEVRHLYVFQRTAAFSVPARNLPLAEKERAAFRSNYAEIRRRAREDMKDGIVQEVPQKSALDDTEDARWDRYEARWQQGGLTFTNAYNDIRLNQMANDTAANFIRKKISEIVENRDTAKLLQPHGYPLGTKRICIDTGYYQSFNRPNVELVDISSNPIDEILPDAVVSGGRRYDVDALIFATGFDAMTGSVARIEIQGRNGLTLNEKWSSGPRTYLGLMSAGFPNLFIVAGPGSPSVLSNMIVSIEQHVEWIADCIQYMSDRGMTSIEATVSAEEKWTEHVQETAAATLYPQANSWYLGANIPGKPRIFMPYLGGVAAYRAMCTKVAAGGYDGFALSAVQRSDPAVSRG
jgi:cyclohexanone monooxygenase